MREVDPRRVAVGRVVAYLLRSGWTPPPLDEVMIHAILDDLDSLDRHRVLAAQDSDPLLTPAQAKVLQRSAEGMSNAEIADDLGCALSTVKFHLSDIFLRLDARTRAHAVAKAISLGEIRGL